MHIYTYAYLHTDVQLGVDDQAKDDDMGMGTVADDESMGMEEEGAGGEGEEASALSAPLQVMRPLGRVGH